MNQIRGLGLVACGTSLALALVTAHLQAQTHKHEPAGAAVHKPQLNQGKKWATDEPLRKGMNEIRSLIIANDEAIHNGKLARDAYASLGSKVEEQVAYMVANCKLETKADENLHLVLADIILGADAMKGNEKKLSPRAGAGKIAAALNTYGRYFDHPGWKKL